VAAAYWNEAAAGCVSAANRALSREAAASGGPSLPGGAASVDAIYAAVNAALPSS